MTSDSIRMSEALEKRNYIDSKCYMILKEMMSNSMEHVIRSTDISLYNKIRKLIDDRDLWNDEFLRAMNGKISTEKIEVLRLLEYLKNKKVEFLNSEVTFKTIEKWAKETNDSNLNLFLKYSKILTKFINYNVTF